MRSVFHSVSLAVLSATSLAGLPTFAQEGAPVAQPVAAQVSMASQVLSQASAQLHAGQYGGARDALKTIINTPTEPVRSQSRYLLAWALLYLGQPTEALEALEGTLADGVSSLGRAVGTLRGNILLHQAELLINTNQPDRAAALLTDYERSSLRPDDPRHQRLKFTLSPTGERLNQPLRVGVIVPQTGTLGVAGTDVVRALQLALPALTANRRPVTLLVRDATTPAEVATAATELRTQGVAVVVGPLLAPAVAAAQSALPNTPILTLSSDAFALGSDVHTLNFLPTQQAEAAARAALATGKTRFAALIPHGPYGEAALNGLRDALSNQSAQLVATAFYAPSETDIGATIRQLKEEAGLGFEALLLPAPGRLAPMLAAQLAYYDLDKNVQLLGTALWQDPAVLQPSAASALRGALFAAPLATEDFNTRFTQTFGAAPHPLAALGTDAAHIIAQLSMAQAHSGQSIASLLLRPEGFYAPGGATRFLRNGQTLRALGVNTIGTSENRGTLTALSSAATLFPPPLPETLLPEPRRSWW